METGEITPPNAAIETCYYKEQVIEVNTKKGRTKKSKTPKVERKLKASPKNR